MKRTCSATDCDRSPVARGWCDKHYRRWRRTVDGPLFTPAREKFWERVEKTESCWLWRGCIDPQGYGRANLDGRSERAHRAAYQLAVGPIPEGMFLDHKCHNPACVNPDHLQPVTPRLNSENRAGAQKRSGTGVRGVFKCYGSSTYEVRVHSRGKSHRLYGFKTVAEAEVAAIALRNRLMTNNLADR